MKENLINGKFFTYGVVIVLLAGGIASAQDYFFTNFQFGYQTHKLPVNPCVEKNSSVQTSNAWFYDTTAWVYYLCTDGTEYQRRFFHPIDNMKVSNSPAPAKVTAPPLLSSCSHIPNFVPSVGGGCVPPDHPHAVK